MISADYKGVMNFAFKSATRNRAMGGGINIFILSIFGTYGLTSHWQCGDMLHEDFLLFKAVNFSLLSSSSPGVFENLTLCNRLIFKADLVIALANRYTPSAGRPVIPRRNTDRPL